MSLRLANTPFTEGCPIERFIENRIIDEMPITEAKAQKVTRRILKGIGFVLAGVGNVPFIEVNLAGGGSSLTLGVALTYGNTASYTCLISWAIGGMVDDELRAKSEEEVEFSAMRKIECCGRTVILVASMGIGLISQFPIAYFGYAANAGGWFPPVLMPVATLISDSWLSVYSSKLSMEKMVLGKQLTSFEKKLEKNREAIIGFIEENQKLLAGSDREKAVFYTEALKNIRTSFSNRSELYLETVAQETGIEGPKGSSGRTWNIVTTSVGIGIASIQMFMLGYLSYEGMIGGVGPKVLASVLAVGANVYLQGRAIVGTTKKVCNVVKNLFFGRYQKNLNEQLAPVLTALLKILALGTAALSYGPAWEMTASFEDAGARIFLGVGFSVGTFLLIATAMLDITDQVLIMGIKSFGNEEALLLVDANEKMKMFCALLKRSPFIEYARFLKVIPQRVLARLEEDCMVASQELDDYINAHEGLSERRPLLGNIQEV